MECVTGASSVRKVVKCSRNLGNLFHYTRNVDNLRTQVEELKDKRNSVKDGVGEAEKHGKSIRGSVQNWLSRADDIYDEAETFLNDVEGHAKARCSCESAPSLSTRNRLSREANKMVRAVRKLLDEGKSYEFKGEEAFETRMPIFEGIMEALRDPNVSVIGMYGMGGIGKTTLATEVARQAKEEKLFSEVVMTCVSQTPDIDDIQREIAKGIKIAGERRSPRRDKVKHKNIVLLILDDIWKSLDLPSVGILLERGQNGKKILVISRSLDVVRNLGAEKIFKIEVLSFGESIYLFNKAVGSIIEALDFQACGHEIVKECAGVPVAIETFAYALKDKPLLYWKNALVQLKLSNPTAMEGICQKVYSCISTSYDILSSEEVAALLLCSLHEEDEDIKVENLLRYSVGWGLFQEAHTLEEARCKVKILVDNLKSCCLLLDGNCQETVTMNKVVRYVATIIASKEKHVHYVQNVAKLEECLEEEKLKESKAISLLVYDDFCRVHEGLDCPELELFFMLHAFGSLPIPDPFFEKATKLRSLSLNGACLESLPPSFYLLQRLETLCLCSCDLKDIDWIGELKTLKVLDLSESTIEELPEKIGQLTCLQLLDLRGCRHLRVVKKNAISSLVRLEELYMAEEYDNWEVEGVVEGSNIASLLELKGLQQLTVLFLNVLDAKSLPKDLFSGKLKSYRISVGGKRSFDGAGISKSLYLNLDERSQLNELDLELLMKRSEELALEGFRGLDNVVCELDVNGFPLLKRLQFQNNDGVEYMVDDVGVACGVFPSLESLFLRKLSNMMCIFQQIHRKESFKELREIRVTNCPKLVTLLPLFIIERLHYIQVEECPMLEVIAEYIGVTRVINSIEANLALRCLTLKYLPNLTQFCWSYEHEESYRRHKWLFSGQISLPELEELTLYDLNIEGLWPLWLRSSYSLQNLKTLHVEDCNNLSHLLPFAIVRSLVQLKELRVRACRNMEVLVMMEEQGEEQRLEDISFCKLETLELFHLPRLRRFCAAACLSCPSLLKLTITGCKQLRLINFPVSTFLYHDHEIKKGEYFERQVTCPNLEELNLFDHYSETVGNILRNRNLAALLMQTLTSLNVERWELKNLMPSTAAKRLLQLKQLQIKDCFNIEVVVVSIFEQEEERFENIALFPKLKSLELTNLLKLKTFSDGDCKVKLPSLLKLTLRNCPKLETLATSMPIQASGDDKELGEVDLDVTPHLFNESGVLMFPDHLEELNLSWMNVTKLWVDQLPSNLYMQNLKSLIVGNCSNLRFLFSSIAVGRLVQLKQLSVYKEVLVIKEEEEGTSEDISFPKLECLELHNLPRLKWFCAEACVSCPSLLKLSVQECPKLVSIVFSPTPPQLTLHKQLDQEMDLLPGKSLQRMVTLDWEN